MISTTPKVLYVIVVTILVMILIHKDDCHQQRRDLLNAIAKREDDKYEAELKKYQNTNTTSVAVPRMKTETKMSFEDEVREKWKNSAGLYKDKTLHPELKNIILVTMVNNAYEEMFDNWKCHAQKHGLDFMVLAFDYNATQFMGPAKSIQLPGIETTEQIKLNSNRFNIMGCQKVDALIAFLEAGADVIIIDADCVFKQDPLPFFKNALQYDFVYQSNHPACREIPSDLSKMDPACFLLNSGFYYASSRNQELLQLFKKAMKSCYAHANSPNLSPTDGAGDQRAIQRAFNEELNLNPHYYGDWGSKLKKLPAVWKPTYELEKPSFFKSARFCQRQSDAKLQSPTFEYCVLDPQLFPAGKHKVRSHEDIIAYHANHLPGGIARKKKQLAKNGVWGKDGKC